MAMRRLADFVDGMNRWLGLSLRWRSLVRRYGAALPRHTTADSWTALLSAASEHPATERT